MLMSDTVRFYLTHLMHQTMTRWICDEPRIYFESEAKIRAVVQNTPPTALKSQRQQWRLLVNSTRVCLAPGRYQAMRILALMVNLH